MDDQTYRDPQTVASLLRALREPYGPRLEADNEATQDSAYCAQIKLYAGTQYAFYVAFQLLVLVIAVAVATSLVILIIRLTDEVDVTGVVGSLGTLATGGAAGFLQKAANAARSRYDAAREELRVAGCH